VMEALETQSGSGMEQTPNQRDLYLDRAVLAVRCGQSEELENLVAIDHGEIVDCAPTRERSSQDRDRCPSTRQGASHCGEGGATLRIVCPEDVIALRATNSKNAKGGTWVVDAAMRL